MSAMRLLVCASALVVLGAGCIWNPPLEENGYTACEVDADCALGRSCEVGLCAPPPWHDSAFKRRQLLVIENPSSRELPKGAAIPVRIGAGGVVSNADVDSEGRFLSWRRDTATFEDVRVYRDFFNADDYYVAWLALPDAVAPGAKRELAWIETDRPSDDTASLVLGTEQFLLFDDFASALAVDPDRYATYGQSDPTIDQGVVTVRAGQKLVATTPLRPPFSATFRGTFVGLGCDRVFVGLMGDDGISYAAPSAGFFVGDALSAVGEVAPTADSVPTGLGVAARLDNAQHRYTVDIDEGVRFWVDDAEFVAETELRPPFEDAELFMTIDMDGDCFFELDALFASPLPLQRPVVSAQAPVTFVGFGE